MSHVALLLLLSYSWLMSGSLRQLTHQLVRLSRQGREATAAGMLNDFVTAFEDEIGCFPVGTQQTLLRLLPKLLHLQEERDWAAYADVLEYELLPLIG